jgi:hypothetical protein
MFFRPSEERAELVQTIAMLVSSELLGEYNMSQDCYHAPNDDGLIFPPTENRPQVSVSLPPTLDPDRLRELVREALSSYISKLPPELRPS